MKETVVDADGHVLEPTALWNRFLAPHVVRDDWGLDTVYVGTQAIVAAPLGLLGTPGSRMDETDPVKKIPWEEALPALLPHVGEDRVVWGSDYPHHDATFPGAVKKLRSLIEPLSESARQRILGANAGALYRLAEP